MLVLDTDHRSLLQWNLGAEGRLLDGGCGGYKQPLTAAAEFVD
jgi:hypothetical protein